MHTCSSVVLACIIISAVTWALRIQRERELVDQVSTRVLLMYTFDMHSLCFGEQSKNSLIGESEIYVVKHHFS